ncbi:MAG: hypothetical protein ACFFAU_05680 [Candidatus Hodarchaeota archaeon]
MLKEIFVIADGILFFHYSIDPKSMNSDETILSSGLLTAIQNFSESARTDALDSFTMANEYFLFKKFLNTHKTLVGVFESHTPQKLSRNSLNKIFDLIIKSELPQEEGFINLYSPEKLLLKKQIDKLLNQFFGTKEDAYYVNELISKRTDIPLALLLDANEKKLITKFARPKPLFKDYQVNDYFLLYSTLQTTISRIGLPVNYAYCVIKSDQYCLASVFSGKNISLATGSLNTPVDVVLDAALKMCRFESVTALTGDIGEVKSIKTAKLNKEGVLSHSKGEEFPPMISIYLLTLINNINNFFQTITRRNFIEFSLLLKNESYHKLNIERKNFTEDFIITVIDYS